MEQKRETDQLNFTPLSEGLGFHPFSDGLPYAPVNPGNSAAPRMKIPPQPTPSTLTPYRGGSGATAAGPVGYARPTITRAPRVSVPITQAAATVQNLPPLIEAAANENLGILYLLKRSTAYLIDLMASIGVGLAATFLALWWQDAAFGGSGNILQVINEMGAWDLSTWILLGLVYSAFSWILVTAQELAFSTTLGKRIFGLRLNGSLPAIFLRAFFFLPSIGFLGLGVLWALFDRRGRCWHDLVVDVQPLEIAQWP